MNLSLNGVHAGTIDDPDELGRALSDWSANDGDFVILEDGDDDYIQSAIDPHGYIVELRDGAAATMYRAVRMMPQPGQRRDRWSRQEALSLIRAYFPMRGRAAQAEWEDMHMQTISKSAGARLDWTIRLIGLVAAGCIVGYLWLVKR